MHWRYEKGIQKFSTKHSNRPVGKLRRIWDDYKLGLSLIGWGGGGGLRSGSGCGLVYTIQFESEGTSSLESS
jgi:hypothetical protein